MWHLTIIQRLVLFFAVTSDKTWHEEGTKTGPLHPTQYYLPSSHIIRSPQAAWVALPNTHKAEHQQGLCIPCDVWRLNCITPIKHSEGDLKTNNSRISEESTPALSEPIGRSTTTCSSPQTKSTLAFTQRQLSTSLTVTQRGQERQQLCWK